MKFATSKSKVFELKNCDMIINSMMSKLFFVSMGLFVFGQQAAAEIRLTLPTLQAPTVHVQREYTDSTLAGIAARLPGIVQGRYTFSFRVDYTLRGHREDCCVDAEEGEKWVIDPADDNLDFSIVITQNPKVYLPTWSQIDSVCESARNEFNNYRSGVSDHEYGHHDVAVTSFSEDNKPNLLVLFQTEVIRDESECVEGVDQDLQEAGAPVYERTDERVEYAINQTAGSINGDQNAAHEYLPYPSIDTTKDCE